MTSKRVHLTFPEQLVQEPIVSRLVRQYELDINIRRADVDERVGWMILEMIGEDAALAEGTAYLESLGIVVSDPGGDIVAG